VIPSIQQLQFQSLPLQLLLLEFSATDSSGNDAKCYWNINAQDTTPPVITLPSTVIKEVEGPLTPLSSAEIGQATAEDLHQVTLSLNNPPSEFPPGVTIVEWIASDEFGNTANSRTANSYSRPNASCNNRLSYWCRTSGY